MKKIVTWIILSMLAAVVAVWNIACGISESYRYRRDRDCAIMTTIPVPAIPVALRYTTGIAGTGIVPS